MPDIKWLKGDDDLSLCLEMRKNVFCTEQKIKEEPEFDCLDEKSLHLLILENSSPVGTGRITEKDNKTIHFGHIAIDKAFRKKGLGKILIDEMIKKSKELGKYTSGYYKQETVSEQIGIRKAPTNKISIKEKLSEKKAEITKRENSTLKEKTIKRIENVL
mgnify:CR=1 FL=1